MIRRRSHARSGFAVVEAVLSALIVGLMLAAAIETVGKSRASQAWAADRVRAYELAADLMGEITDLRYADPELVTLLLGPDGTELLVGRSAFDDVDDYHGLSETPPKKRDGTALPGYSGWTRSVAVSWPSAADLNLSSAGETSMKRVTVTVKKGGKKLAEIVAIRTSAVNR
jgi:MSHA pilin protein MshD